MTKESKATLVGHASALAAVDYRLGIATLTPRASTSGETLNRLGE